MAVKLLAIPASHPCASVAAMLDAKGVDYQRCDLFPALSRAWLRMTGFAAGTVPALKIDGVRVQGSCAIARTIDAAWPDPPLYPDDPAARARVEEIETWGDGELQDVARRIALWGLLHSRAGVRAALTGARLPLHLPPAVAALSSWPVIRLDAALNGADRGAVDASLAALPAMLDRIDAWIEAGVVDVVPPTAADYQLAGSLRLLLSFADLAALFADRPATRLADRLIPDFPGRVPAGVLPVVASG